MALLMGRVALSVLVLLIASCSGDSEVGGIEVDLYEGDVDCELGFECRNPDGMEASYERLSGFAFLTTETSEHHPNGLFVYFELERADGTIARGEMDLPLDGVGEASISYTEARDSEVVFAAAEAIGIVEVPEEAWGEECDCLDGRLELILRDADGVTRRLSRGRFGWGDRPCVERARFTNLDDELTVVPRTCGADRSTGPTRYEEPPARDDYRSPPSADTGAGCDSSACNGVAAGSSSCTGGSSSGCDSGGGGCDGGGGGGGCEGDVGGAGGCAGDTSGGGGCAGDTGGGCRVVGRPRQIGPRGPLQTALLIGAALAWVVRPRRYR